MFFCVSYLSSYFLLYSVSYPPLPFFLHIVPLFPSPITYIHHSCLYPPKPFTSCTKIWEKVSKHSKLLGAQSGYMSFLNNLSYQLPWYHSIWLPHVYENMRGITSSSFPTLQTHKQKKAEDMNTRVCNISEYLKYLQRNNGTKDYTLLTFQVQ